MASKRSATSELNHDNWDEDAEPEDAGNFKKASEDVLKRRVIKTARRRNLVTSSDEEGGTKNAFSSFSGFGKSSSNSSSPFAFLSNFTPSSNNNSPLKTNGSVNKEKIQTAMDSVKSDSLNNNPSIESKQAVSNDSALLKPQFSVASNSDAFSTPPKPQFAFTLPSKGDTSTSKTVSDSASKLQFSTGSKTDLSAIPKNQFSSGSKTDLSAVPKMQFSSGSKTDLSAVPKMQFSSGSKTDLSAVPKKQFSTGSNTNLSAVPKFSYSSADTSGIPKFSFTPSTSTSTVSFGANNPPKPAEMTESSSAQQPIFSFGKDNTEKSTEVETSVQQTPQTFSFGVNSSSKSNTDVKSSVSTAAVSLGTSTAVKSTTSETNGNAEETRDSKSRKVYFSKLRQLNESVSQWIKTHVDKNPLCILTPVFRDYDKHLKSIEKYNTSEKANVLQKEVPQSTPIVNDSETKINIGNLKEFKIVKEETKEKSNETKESLNNPEKKKEDEVKKPPSFGTGFSFGASNITPSSGFSFGESQTFAFGNIPKPSISESTNIKADDEEDEPPKAEFTPVIEDDCVYTKRCKAFIKKDGQFTERGVGNLFLKPIKDSEKVQVIVRADTNLGNVLLNFVLSKSIPVQRMGKNNVMLCCIPDPEAKPPPVPILLRVKTAEDADELLKTLEEHKK